MRESKIIYLGLGKSAEIEFNLANDALEIIGDCEIITILGKERIKQLRDFLNSAYPVEKERGL